MSAEYGKAPQERDLSAFITHNATVTGLVKGAVAVGIPGGDNWRDVELPGGAASLNVIGVVYDDYGATGPAVGQPVALRVEGLGQVNLAPTEAIDYEDELITANAAGDVKKRTVETGCHVVGISKAKVTAGASHLPIQALIGVRKIY